MEQINQHFKTTLENILTPNDLNYLNHNQQFNGDLVRILMKFVQHAMNHNYDIKYVCVNFPIPQIISIKKNKDSDDDSVLYLISVPSLCKFLYTDFVFATQCGKTKISSLSSSSSTLPNSTLSKLIDNIHSLSKCDDQQRNNEIDQFSKKLQNNPNIKLILLKFYVISQYFSLSYHHKLPKQFLNGYEVLPLDWLTIFKTCSK